MKIVGGEFIEVKIYIICIYYKLILNSELNKNFINMEKKCYFSFLKIIWNWNNLSVMWCLKF